MKRSIISNILKLIVFVCGITGVILSIIEYSEVYGKGTTALLYFTIQSNIWISLWLILLLVLNILEVINKKDYIKRWMYLVKLIFTVSITLTGMVYCFVLVPSAPAGYNAWAIDSVLTHVIVPLVSIIDFFVDGYKFDIRKKEVFLAIIPPLYYLIFTIIAFILNADFGGGYNYPYFFLNFTSPAGIFGFSDVAPNFMGTFYWVIILLIFVVSVALIYRMIYLKTNNLNINVKKLIKEKKSIISIIIVFIVIMILLIGLISYAKDTTSIFEQYYHMKVLQFEKENEELRLHKTEVDIVFIGDSITEGFELNKTPYEENYEVAWRGIGGDNTFGLYDRLKVSVYDLNPKLIVLCIGGNNLNTMMDNYEEILKDIKENLPETKVIVQSIYPTSKTIVERNAIIPGINEELKALVDKYNYSFVDTHSAVVNENNEFDEKYTDDGAHPNEAGYRRICEVLLPVIDWLLE